MTEVGEKYAREIRDWLLGRLAKQHTSGEIAEQSVHLDHQPILWWWLFEGRRFAGLDSPLADAWPWVTRQTRLLLTTYNARLREQDRPEGEVDWQRSLSASAGQAAMVYVQKTSQAGLGADERAALQTWIAWITIGWRQHCAAVGELDLAATAELEQLCPPERFGDELALRRAAHVARRSRWPLLRILVAESLRAKLEPEELDRLPLPAEHDKLFELLCLVRMAAAMHPAPQSLRWLDLEMSDNCVRLPSAACKYQRKFKKEVTRQAFCEAAVRGFDAFGVAVPSIADLLWQFPDPRGGWDGVLVEVKSGGQDFNAGVEQMRVYAQAVRADRQAVTSFGASPNKVTMPQVGIRQQPSRPTCKQQLPTAMNSGSSAAPSESAMLWSGLG